MVSLKCCPNLQVLDLSDNFIDSDQINIILSSDLSHFSNLNEVNLDSNGMGDEGAKTVSVNLQYCCNLQTLTLGNNMISSIGCKALAAQLHHCTQLQTLDLRNNDIGNKKAKAIATSLKCCKKFQLLTLSGRSCFDFAKTFKKENFGFNIHFIYYI